MKRGSKNDEVETGKLVALHQVRTPLRRGFAADVGVGEERVEPRAPVHVVVALQDRAPQALAEAARAQQHRHLVLFQLANKTSLVDEMVTVADNLLVIGNAIWNAFHHAVL